MRFKMLSWNIIEIKYYVNKHELIVNMRRMQVLHDILIVYNPYIKFFTKKYNVFLQISSRSGTPVNYHANITLFEINLLNVCEIKFKTFLNTVRRF